jgi:hypothetical protein
MGHKPPLSVDPYNQSSWEDTWKEAETEENGNDIVDGNTQRHLDEKEV